MKWDLAIVAAAVMAVAAVSRRLTGTPVTTAMAFVLLGLMVGPLVIDELPDRYSRAVSLVNCARR